MTEAKTFSLVARARMGRTSSGRWRPSR